MKNIQRIVFIIWVTVFILSVIYNDNIVIDSILSIISMLYILELVFVFFSTKNKLHFLQENWIDIILLFPIFKIVKITKAKKLIKHIAKPIRDNVINIIDMMNKFIELQRN